MWSNKMWHHAAFWSSHLLKAIRCVSHTRGGEGIQTGTTSAAVPLQTSMQAGDRLMRRTSLSAPRPIGSLRQSCALRPRLTVCAYVRNWLMRLRLCEGGNFALKGLHLNWRGKARKETCLEEYAWEISPLFLFLFFSEFHKADRCCCVFSLHVCNFPHCSFQVIYFLCTQNVLL